MACAFGCFLYPFLFLVLAAVLTKIYMKVTTGRHKIKRSLKGKVVVITGGTAGIGKETVRELAKHDATIHVLARDLNKAERVLGEIKESTGNNDIHIHHVDLNDFSTVRSFASGFLRTQSPIHILINNAGLFSMVKKYTVDGNEETTQSNHLGHFLLTNLLLDRVVESAPSRVINVSSEGHNFLARKFDPYDINFNEQSSQWDSFESYVRSKLMNVLFTRELARRLYGKGVTVNALHPGAVSTEFSRAGATWKIPMTIFFQLFKPLFKNEVEGAQTTLYLATADEVEHVSGHYFADCKLSRIALSAADDKLASDLWVESERIIGLAK